MRERGVEANKVREGEGGGGASKKTNEENAKKK